jgi:DhnA family fructose-bisphosphate aldolase class Ia
MSSPARKQSMIRGKDIRLSKLFNRNENAVVIAIDHGYMDGPIPGMENLPQTIGKIDSAVDAVLLSPGMMQVVGDYFGCKGAPISIVRLNWSTVFCFEWGYSMANTVQAFSVEDAIRLGADLVLVSLTLKTGDEANDAHNVEVFAKLCNEARRFDIPVIGECFPNNSDNLSPEEMHDLVLKGTRILAELGADCIKTFHTHKFAEVVNGCPLPILGLGGHATPNPVDSLRLAKQEIDEGAKGVVFGRNALQRPDPIAYQKALCDVVKHGLNPTEAVRKYNLK